MEVTIFRLWLVNANMDRRQNHRSFQADDFTTKTAIKAQICTSIDNTQWFSFRDVQVINFMYFVAEPTTFLEHSQLLVPGKLFLFHIKLFCYITSCWTELNLFTAIDKRVLQLIIISHFETCVSERYSSMWEEAEIPGKKTTYRRWRSRGSNSDWSGEIILVYIYKI